MKLYNIVLFKRVVVSTACCNLFFLFLLPGLLLAQSGEAGENLEYLVREVKEQIRIKKEAGDDIAELLNILHRSKREVQSGNEEEGIRILQEALRLAEGTESLNMAVGRQTQTPPEPRKQIGTKAANKDDVEAYLQQIRNGIRVKKENGEDVSELLDLLQRSKRAISQGYDEEGIQLLQQALYSINSSLKNSDKKNELNSNAVPEKGKINGKVYTVKLPTNAEQLLVTSSVPEEAASVLSGTAKNKPPFSSKIFPVRDGLLSVKLDDAPLFIEPRNNNDKDLVFHSYPVPFGIHGVEKDSEALNDSLCTWLHFASKPFGAAWDNLEPEQGKFEWEKHDNAYRTFYDKGINVVPVIKSINRWDRGLTDLSSRPEFGLPNDIKRYSQFVYKLVERYDGDGFADAPGSPIVQYWQIENEAQLNWKDSTKNFARQIVTTSKQIKKANKDAKVILGALANDKWVPFLQETLEHLYSISGGSSKVFDILDLHWAGDADGYAVRTIQNRQNGISATVDLQKSLNQVRALLAKYGYQDVSIWINEISTHSGSPVTREGTPLKVQTERDQAVGLVKLMVFPLSIGVERTFWVTLDEWHSFGGVINGYYDNVGLIHNPKNSGLEGKKMSYYTFQHLIRQTRGVDWRTIKKLESGYPDISLFSIIKNGKPFFIMWRDKS